VARTKGGTEGKTTLDELTTFAEETLLEDFELLELLDRTLLEELFSTTWEVEDFPSEDFGLLELLDRTLLEELKSAGSPETGLLHPDKSTPPAKSAATIK